MVTARFRLRRGVAADAPALWAIRVDGIRDTCRTHYPDELIERWAASPLPETFASDVERKDVVVGEARARIAGFAILDASIAEIEAVFVAPAEARRGLGRQLLSQIEATASGQGVHRLVLDASLNAVPFYLACGFTPFANGIHTTRAGVQIPCVRMEKTII